MPSHHVLGHDDRSLERVPECDVDDDVDLRHFGVDVGHQEFD